MENLSIEAASNILSAWTALEVLSPQSFGRRHDLAESDQSAIVHLDRDGLPWEGNEEKVSETKKLFYHVVIGTLDLEKAVAALLEKYPDEHFEPPLAKKNAVLAAVVVNQQGFLLQGSLSVAVSSFAWGIQRALTGDLTSLSDWDSVEQPLLTGFAALLCRTDDNGNLMAVDKPLLTQAYAYLVNCLEVPLTIVSNSVFAIKVSRPIIKVTEFLTTCDPPRPLLLNSFYLRDLKQADRLISEDNAPKLLKQYLGLLTTAQRHNLLSGHSSLEEAVAPQLIPPARWPSPEGHTLVLLQQAAVNLALNKLPAGGILAVNGPPGTGKTTLLRDIVAGLVTQRAEAMCSFDDPATAFTLTSEEKVTLTKRQFSSYALDDSLKGFELLLASSNNKAIENISRELPSLKAIAEDADDLRYFRVVSDKLFKCETWGLISAVLGNTSNRRAFLEAFWWDPAVGFKRYLAGIVKTSKKKVAITNDSKGNPLPDRRAALRYWEQARKDFQTKLTRCRARLAELEEIRLLFKAADALAPNEVDLQALEAQIEAQLAKHYSLKPGFIVRLFKAASLSRWEQHKEVLSGKKTQISQVVQARARRNRYRKKLKQHLIDKQRLTQQAYPAVPKLPHKQNKQPQDEQQEAPLQTMTPWCDQAVQALRAELFVAAIKLHEAFIDCAAEPLYSNLSLFVGHFTKPDLLEESQNNFLADLWSSFCLVVPCISSTFASINRMLGKLPPESLGWLVIDEAGQAAPQAAVGAIVRAKQAIIVGDPLQIEPVVLVPTTLTRHICQYFGVDARRFNAPDASVQTLADRASVYFSEFKDQYGSRSAGVPLLVHRRCDEPMFAIANSIAYEQLMIQAKQPKSSAIRDSLGPSAWFDITDPCEDRWSIAEGEQVLTLLRRLKTTTVAPDIYIITPFVDVVRGIRDLIRESQLLQAWKIADGDQWLLERVGTVHRVQGREAEAVILVLGAPAVNHECTRRWAGTKPNLLNVAVTRAKEVIYVIGNRTLWREAGLFRELSDQLE